MQLLLNMVVIPYEDPNIGLKFMHIGQLQMIFKISSSGIKNQFHMIFYAFTFWHSKQHIPCVSDVSRAIFIPA